MERSGTAHAVTVAALYVETGGVYFGLPDVDPWDVTRDARLYAGPHPVVAHPPCNRWCAGLADVNQARYGLRVGDDGGTFAAALESVRAWGGVLELRRAAIRHRVEPRQLPRRVPVRALRHFADPPAAGAALPSALERTRQAECAPCVRERRVLDWSRPPHTAVISYDARSSTPRAKSMWGKQNSRSPLAFRDALLNIARTARKAVAA